MALFDEFAPHIGAAIGRCALLDLFPFGDDDVENVGFFGAVFEISVVIELIGELVDSCRVVERKHAINASGVDDAVLREGLG